MPVKFSNIVLLKLIAAFLILTINKAQAQSVFKQKKNFSFNFLGGYQSFSNTEALNKALIAANFKTVEAPHFF